jgi:8-oxo-dGTP diphosphatase
MVHDFTHAGGIVLRRVDDVVLYLIITAKKRHDHWVLPKGHVRLGETSEQAATREVREETGIEAKVVAFVGHIRFADQHQAVNAGFFLMEYVGQTDEAENRIKRWCTYDEAIELLTFDDSRDILRKARRLTINDRE